MQLRGHLRLLEREIIKERRLHAQASIVIQTMRVRSSSIQIVEVTIELNNLV